MKNKIPIKSLSRNIYTAIVILFFEATVLFCALLRARTHTSYKMLQCRKFLYFMLMTRFLFLFFRIIFIQQPENDDHMQFRKMKKS